MSESLVHSTDCCNYSKHEKDNTANAQKLWSNDQLFRRLPSDYSSEGPEFESRHFGKKIGTNNLKCVKFYAICLNLCMANLSP